MTKPDILQSLIAKGVRFTLKNKGLSYHSEINLSAEELLWIGQNKNYVASLLLENRLSQKRYLYDACVNFERKPFHRQLSPDCIAAGHEAIQRLTVEIKHLEQQIEKLKKDNLS